MSAVEEGNIDINNEDRREVTVQPSGQNGNLQIITNSNTAEFKMSERRTFEEMCRKRKKHRRGKPKKKQWLRRREQTGKDGESTQIAMKRRRANVFPHGQPAPNNTTQFIMEDHTDLQIQYFNEHCNTAAEKANVGPGSSTDKTGRARDSSFSVDSDDEFYSSPEDEEEFLTKEFSNTYEDVHVERLGTMTKTELIEEYLQLEKRVDSLEKKLKVSQNSRAVEKGGSGTGNDSDGEAVSGELHMEPDTAEKIRIFQEEINKLIVANEELLKENNRLRTVSGAGTASPFSSVDSESDSSSSSESSHSSSSSNSHKSKTSPMSEGCKNGTGSSDSFVDAQEVDQVLDKEEGPASREEVEKSGIPSEDLTNKTYSHMQCEPFVNGVSNSEGEVEEECKEVK